MRIVVLAICGALLAASPLVRAGEAGGGNKPKPQPKTGELSRERREKLAKLIAQLGHEEWAEREEASVEIEKFGKAAEEAEKKAAEEKKKAAAEKAKAKARAAEAAAK
jgi:hypothetical protein